MLINFVSDPIKNSSNRWRNFFALALVFFGVGFIMVSRIGLFVNISAASEKFNPKTLLASYSLKIGGDLEITPPLLPAPPLWPVPTLIGELPSSTIFTAKAFFVKDLASNQVLFAKDENTTRPTASIAKLMTVLVLLEKSIDWDAVLTVVGEEDLVDSHMYAGDTYSYTDLWNAALVGSSNKAIFTMVVGQGYSMETFVARMNQKAIELGLANTHFADPAGLDQNTVSNASDVALLLNAALGKSEIKESLLKREYVLYSKERKKKHHMWSTDWLLLNWIPQNSFTVLGGKTGYTEAAEYNFTVAVKNKEDREIIVVVLGADTHEARFFEARDLAKAVFGAYEWKSVFVADQ